MTYDSQMTASGEKRLKKKRSAFGWLKKAFSLDEEERQAYEARRQQQTPNMYYDNKSPKFLDVCGTPALEFLVEFAMLRSSPALVYGIHPRY
ncbi:hypothetical protein ColKHC_11750 [Colletotrichum higginsianum]|nr:hypothetical protein ColKHC_11750 [Colletotrichum higginsianum]